MSQAPHSPTDVSAEQAASGWRTWPPLAVSLGCAGAYALFFLLPFYVNDLDRLPLGEVAIGFHDPKDLWPYDTAVGGLLHLGGVLTLMLGPGVVLGVPAWVTFVLWRDRTRHTLRDRAVLLLAALVALGTLAWLATPFGEALMQWFLD